MATLADLQIIYPNGNRPTPSGTTITNSTTATSGATYTPTTPNYTIDYNDSRFGEVESDKEQALTEIEQTYGGMIDSTDRYFDEQIQASKDWADKQSQLQQERTDFTIEQVNQQKEEAYKDYLKEQSASYVDWQKQSNKYGTNAEQLASAGLTNTGFSESSQVSMYNTYQNRVATARESYNKAVLNYNNAIKDAQLQNNAALAEIAYNALKEQLSLSLEGFQYKNQLITELSDKRLEIDNIYYNRYQDVLEQLNRENELKEDIRQYNETMAWNTEQADLDRQFQAQQAELERQFQSYEAQLERDFEAQQAEAQRQFQEEQAAIEREFEEEQAALERQHEREMLEAETKAEKERLQQQHELEMQQLAREQEYRMAQLEQQQRNELEQMDRELANERAILNQQLANEKALAEHEASLSRQSVGSVSGSSSSSSGSRGSSGTVSSSTPRYETPAFNGSTYEEAVKYLRSQGINSSGVLTASEWSRRRASYTTTGIGNAAVKNYSSYSAYLRDYVNYSVSNK